MHRNSSRSLRHVGKLNEGYLSDVHTSFSNIQYDSDASSDLMESTKVLEKQFKDKYKVLRTAYERRIEQLTTSVEAVCAQILGDDLIASMRTDAASSVFIPAHISETLASYLKADRESDIQELLERDSALNIQLSRKTAIIDNQNARIAQLEEMSTKGRASEGELEALQDKVKSLEAQYSAFALQARDEQEELRRQQESESRLRVTLQEQLDQNQAELSTKKIELDRLKADNSVKLREVFELEKSIQLTGRDMSYLSEAESRQKLELDQCTQKLKRAVDQRDSAQADVQRLTEKLRSCAEDLERAQASQEQLLREKSKHQQTLDEAVAKSQRAMTEEADRVREEHNYIKQKMKTLTEKFELDVEREKHAAQTYKDEAAISRAVVEEKQREIRLLTHEAGNARDNLDNLHEKLANVREILEDTNGQLLRSKNSCKEWQARAHEAEGRLNEQSFAHKKEKKLMQEQLLADMEKQMEAERKQLESKSDVFRMHYQNQLLDLDISRTNMSLSRSMTAEALPPPPPHSRGDMSMRHSIGGLYDEQRHHDHSHHDHSHHSQSHGYNQGQVRGHALPLHQHSFNSEARVSDHRLVEELQQLKTDHQNLQELLESKQLEATALQAKVQQQQQQQQKMRQKQSYEAQSSAGHHNAAEVERLQGDYEELQALHESKNLEVNRLQQQLKQCQQQLKQQKQQQQQQPQQQQQQQQQQQRHDNNRTLEQTDGGFVAEVEQLQGDYEELKVQYESKRQEARALQMKLQQAADTIEKLKDMVSDAHSVSDSQKKLISKQKEIISELEYDNETARKNVSLASASASASGGATSPTTEDVESQVVGITRVRKLEAEIVRLQGALSQAQTHARQDHEQDSALLESMQIKFETLMANFEASRVDQDESLIEQESTVASLREEIASQKEVIAKHESTVSELQDQVQAMVEFNRQLEATHGEEVEALETEFAALKAEVASAEEASATQTSALKTLQSELDKQVSLAQTSEDTLVQERVELKAVRKKNQKLNDIIFKIDDAYRLQIRELRVALSRVKDNVLVLERSVESEVESITHKTEAFTRPLFDSIAEKFETKLEGEKKRLTSAHMKEEKHLIESLRRRGGSRDAATDENDNSSVNSWRSHESSLAGVANLNQVVDHYKLILKNIFDSLSTSSILDATAAREIMFNLDAANIKLISEQQVGEKNSNTIGVVCAKLYERLSWELNKSVKEKERLGAQVQLMSDMLRKEKISSAELKMSYQRQRSGRSVGSSQSTSSLESAGGDTGASEAQVRKLEAVIEESKLRHKMEIDRLKLQWEKEESARISHLEAQIQAKEALVTEQSDKLRTEQTRRHHLQARLVSEEAEHRAELEDFEQRFFELQRRVAGGSGSGSITNHNH